MSTDRRAALFGYAIAAGVYLLAVLNRTSLGVAGLLAEQRFGIGPAQLSVFLFLQLGVYAVMQVPAGLLADRYDSRHVLAVAALVLGVAQLLFAFVPNYPAALLARTVLGVGDALTYVSVLRYASTHFGPRRYPVLVALTVTAGACGNVLATVPLAAVLHQLGWGVGFGIAAGASLVFGAVVYAVLPSEQERRPRRSLTQARATIKAVGLRVREVWALPGTRLGFWVLFAGMSANNAFMLLWGNSYLIKAAAFTPVRASAVLMYAVVASALGGPVFGWVMSRRPGARVPLAVGACLGTIAVWAIAAAAFGGRPPQAYALALFLIMGVLSQAGLAGFSLARDYNGPRTLGTATGVVNVGSFTATVATTVGIGVALALLGGDGPHAYRLAILVSVLVQAYGLSRVLVWWRRLRAYALSEQHAGRPVPVPVVRRRWDRQAPAPERRGGE